MANIKSAKKRILVIEKKTLRNKIQKTKTKNVIKKLLVAIESNDKAAASVALKNAIKQIDMATSKGVYHKNTSSRKKSRLTALVNKMA